MRSPTMDIRGVISSERPARRDSGGEVYGLLQTREADQKVVDQRKQDRSEDSRQAAVDAKSGHDGGREFQHEAINQEIYNSKCQKNKRQKNDF